MPGPLRVLYLSGPGDVIGTYRHWSAGRDDPREVSMTYSGQFYSACQDVGARGWIISNRDTGRTIDEPPFHIVEQPVPAERSPSALAYYAGQYRFGRTVGRFVRRHQIELMIAANIPHWYVLGGAAKAGARVVPSLHQMLWPPGHRPTSMPSRLIQQLNGRFWRKHVHATIAVSPTAEAQVREIAGPVSSPFYQVRAQYRRDWFDRIKPPRWDETDFNLMFAGRLIAGKGVHLLMEAFEQLLAAEPERYRLHICGSGALLGELQDRAASDDLRGRLIVHGQLDREQMLDVYQQSHAVIVPTTRQFNEGLNRVCVEATLAGRPVITSELSGARGVLDESMTCVDENSASAYAQAIRELANDRARYEASRAATEKTAAQFYDREQGYRQALTTIMSQLIAETR